MRCYFYFKLILSNRLFGFLKGYFCIIIFFRMIEDFRVVRDNKEYSVVIVIDL